MAWFEKKLSAFREKVDLRRLFFPGLAFRFFSFLSFLFVSLCCSHGYPFPRSVLSSRRGDFACNEPAGLSPDFFCGAVNFFLKASG